MAIGVNTVESRFEYSAPRPHPESGWVPHCRMVRRDGNTWTVCFEGHPYILRDVPGLQTLAELVSHPNQEISALILEAEVQPGRAASIPRVALHDSRKRGQANVAAALSAALDHLAADHPALASHLRSAIEVGAFCEYRPGQR